MDAYKVRERERQTESERERGKRKAKMSHKMAANSGSQLRADMIDDCQQHQKSKCK